MAKSFDINNVYLNVAGTRIDGWTDGGGVDVEHQGDFVSENVGSDGLVTRTKDNDDRVHLTINVKRESRAATYLHGLLKAQRAGDQLDFPVSLLDLNDDSTFEVSDPTAYFVQNMDPSIGDGPGEAAFVVSLPKGQQTETTAP
jgi:hypothetical protein